jgi:hypothetical protein
MYCGKCGLVFTWITAAMPKNQKQPQHCRFCHKPLELHEALLQPMPAEAPAPTQPVTT